MNLGSVRQRKLNAQRVKYLEQNYHLLTAEALHVFMDERQWELRGKDAGILMQKPAHTEISDCS